MPKNITPGEALRRVEWPPHQYPHQAQWETLSAQKRALFESRAQNALSLAARIGAQILSGRSRQPDPKGIGAIYQAAKELDASITGMSWDGFNIAGDEASIAEVRRLMFQESRFEAYQARVKEGQA